jgi:hypothetical protein
VSLPSNIDILSHLSKDTSQDLRNGTSLASETQLAWMMARSLLELSFPQTSTGANSVTPRVNPGPGFGPSALTLHSTDRAETPEPAPVRTLTVDSQKTPSSRVISSDMISPTPTFSCETLPTSLTKSSFFGALTTQIRRDHSQSRALAKISCRRLKSTMILTPEQFPLTSSAQSASSTSLTYASSRLQQSRHDSSRH